MENGEPLEKRIKTEPKEGEDVEMSDATKEENGATEKENKNDKEQLTRYQEELGIYYCPQQKETMTKARFDVNLQSMFSSEHYDKKQLLCSVECKLYSRLDDVLFSRSKIRAKLMSKIEQSFKPDDTEQFCTLETEITYTALADVVSHRPSDYNVIEAEPVAEFHTHISLINDKGESLALQIQLENDREAATNEVPKKKRKKDEFNERFVTSIKSMLMKVVKNFPL